MRFVDWNGSGGIDPQDIATSTAIDKATAKEDKPDAPEPRDLGASAGCAAMAALGALAAVLAICVLL